MTNVEFIATYIFNNPGARHITIMRALRKWRNIPERYPTVRWNPNKEYYADIEVQNTWGRQYFNRYANHSNRYLDTHWKTVESGNPRSGYILTAKGLSKVCKEVTPFRCGNRVD